MANLVRSYLTTANECKIIIMDAGQLKIELWERKSLSEITKKMDTASRRATNKCKQ